MSEIIKPTAYTPTLRHEKDIEIWRPRLKSADSESRYNINTAKARAREAVREDAYGANALRISRDSVVGKKFKLSMRPDYNFLDISMEAALDWAQYVEREWFRYAESFPFDADAKRTDTFTFMMHTAFCSMFMNGEILATVQAKDGASGYRTCLNLIEPDRLESPHGDMVKPLQRHGVEQDEFGEPIAYWIRKHHASDVGVVFEAVNKEYERIERYDDLERPKVLHCFDNYRPSMTRGISKMLSTVRNIKMLGTFDDASLEKQILQANYGAVIKSDVNYETAMQLLGATGHKRDGNWENPAMGPALDQLESSSEYHNEMNILFNGSRIPHLVPGEEIQLLESHTNGVEQKEFVDGMIRRLAAGTGVSFESLARNFSDTSYSAARMSLAETWRHFEVTREHLNKRFAMPYVGAWMAEGILEGRLDMPDGIKHNPENWFKFRTGLVQGEFISWTKPLIDPVKEQKGRHLALAMGTSTLESHAAADGEDWQINLEQRAREKKKREELGLNPEDIDPTLAFSGTGSSGQEGNEGGGSGSG